MRQTKNIRQIEHMIIQKQEWFYRTIFKEECFIAELKINYLYYLDGYKCFMLHFETDKAKRVAMVGFKQMKKQQCYNYFIGANNVPYLALKCFGLTENAIYSLEREGGACTYD